MNRNIVFGGIAALVLLLTLITGASVALAAMAGDALTASDSTGVPTASPATPGIPPTATAADPSDNPTWSPVTSEIMPQTPKRLAPGAAASVSDDAIRAWARSAPFANDDPENTAEWAQELVIEVHCMAGKGWDYDPLHGGLARVSPTTPEYLALYGSTGGGDAYQWQNAGCVGYAVHVTGHDGAN